MSKTFRPWDVDQVWLLPPSIQDLVPAGHVAHFVRETVRDGLDLSEVQGTWQAVDTSGRLRLRLKLGAVDDALEAVRLSLTRGDVDATFPGDDRLRLQGQGAAVVLQRRK